MSNTIKHIFKLQNKRSTPPDTNMKVGHNKTYIHTSEKEIYVSLRQI